MDTSTTQTGAREALRIWRLTRRLGIRDVAAKIGKSHTIVWRAENGGPISRDTATALESVTGGDIKADDLLEVA